MRRSTLTVLAAAAVLAVGVFLLRRGPRAEEVPPPRHQNPVSVVPPAAPPPIPTDPQPAPSPPQPLPPPAATREVPRAGLVRGTVRVQGVAPRRKAIRMEADPACAALHAELPLSDVLVRDAENRARWAFVRITGGLEGRTFRAPAVPVILAQVGCRYEPHFLGIQVGQPLVIVNQDPLLHNIHALSFVNHAFNFGQPIRGLEERKTFTASEIIPLRCDVHPWMSAWVGVVDHPYHAVTDAAGAYAIADLPVGRYRIGVWHETCDEVAKDVEIRAGSGSELDFVLDVRK